MKVEIELTDGLHVNGSPTYASGYVAGGTRFTTQTDVMPYANGVFNIGTLRSGSPDRHRLTLPITVANDAVVSEQCLTATLTGNPPARRRPP